MKPNNPLQTVVFINAEIKSEAEEDQEMNFDESEIRIAESIHSDDENLLNVSKKTYTFDSEVGTLLLDNEKPLKNITKKSHVQKISKVENIENLYEVCGYDVTEDTNGQWTCNMCGLKYVSRTRLIYHMLRSHDITTNFKYKCHHCGLEYGRLEGLKKHVKRKHDNTHKDSTSIPNVKYNCKYCGSVYGFKQSLFRHMKVKHLQTDPAEPLQICKLCPATFTQRHNLLYHIKKKHSMKEVFCNDCGLKFLGKKELIDHIDVKHEKVIGNSAVNSAECLNNNEMYKIYNEDTVKWYRNTILYNGKKQCKFCDRILSNTNRLKYHIRTKHSDEFVKLKREMDDIESVIKKIDCVLCGKKYKNSVTLRFHVKIKHSGHKVADDKSFTCEFCGNVFTSRTSLVYHLKKKHIEIEQQVETKDKYELVHVEIEKECSEKTVKQTDNGNLIEEFVKSKKTCIEERYRCDVCSHTCKNLQSIKHHKIARHTSENENIIKCPHCDYVTKFKQYLQKHMSVKHSDSNAIKNHVTYVCEVCGYKTQFKYRFSRHLDTHRKAKICV